MGLALMQFYPCSVKQCFGQMQKSVLKSVTEFERQGTAFSIMCWGQSIVCIWGYLLNLSWTGTRKQNYAVAATLVCDDWKRICFINVGWPGSVHDQRMYRNTVIKKNPGVYLSYREYLLGDLVYTPNPTMVHGYKKFGGQGVLAFGQIFFNDLLSSCHSKFEHTSGIWKGRFPFLTNIQVKIASKKDIMFLIKLVKASAVLHNLFVDRHTVPKSWLSLEDLINPDFKDEVDEELYLLQTLIGSGHSEGTHHEEVHNFLSAKLQR
jgi:hypothetical protein